MPFEYYRTIVSLPLLIFPNNQFNANFTSTRFGRRHPPIKQTTLVIHCCRCTKKNDTNVDIGTNRLAFALHSKNRLHIHQQSYHLHNARYLSPPPPPPTSPRKTQQSPHRMSMFFFRLHNLQREQENKRKKSAEQRQRQRRGGKVFRCVSDSTGHLTLAPSRLFEKTPMSPSDSLDEIALQIPR